MDRQGHWERIYTVRRPDEVSWFQPHATLSLSFIRQAQPDLNTRILDVGGGASTLADDLIGDGYRHVTVLDISAAALDVVRRRSEGLIAGPSLVVGDVTTTTLEPAAYDLWHDRAVFHFLTDPDDRARYVAQVRHALAPGGLLLVATFAEDGPTRCSGLAVVRYDPTQLHAAFGPGFALVESRREEHITPSGGSQWFTYCLCRFQPA